MNIPEWLYWWLVIGVGLQVLVGWAAPPSRFERWGSAAIWLGLLLAFGIFAQ